jgi:hypothetical protein
MIVKGEVDRRSGISKLPSKMVMAQIMYPVRELRFLVEDAWFNPNNYLIMKDTTLCCGDFLLGQ